MERIDIKIFTDRQVDQNSLDLLKTICAILIVGSHLLPLLPYETFNLYYGQWFFRFCVPVFFLSSGYFFSKMNNERRKEYIKRILILYLLSTLLYSPFIIRSYLFGRTSALGIVKYFLLGYDHLWYLIALFYSLLIWYLCSYLGKRRLSDSIILMVCLWLLCIGALFDEYYHLLNIQIISILGEVVDKVCPSRSAVFMGVPLVLIGRHINRHRNECVDKRLMWIYVAIFSCLSLLEVFIILRFNRLNNYTPTCDLTFFNWVPAVFLFIIAVSTNSKISKKKLRMLRKTDDAVYIIHPFIRNVISILLDEIMYLGRFLIVLAVSYFFSYLILLFQKKVKGLGFKR